VATTTLLPLHAGKGRTVATALGLSTDYIKNPEKTDGGEWVTAFECDPAIVDEEFMFSKRQYAALTGRDQGTRDVIGYHLRISFKPGETDAATANKIGYDLAFKLTKGNHAFLVCTHTDKAHVHSHVLINSVSLDYTKKFRNFKNSSFAIRRIADHLCVENGLSIIAKPKPSRGSYGKWQGENKVPTGRDNLRGLIDENIIIGNSLTEFLTRLKKAGVEVKHGKQFSFRPPGSKRFFRQDSLGEDYSAEAILERLTGKRIVPPKQKIVVYVATPRKLTLLIDIQAKLQQAHSPGFEHYAKIYNLKEMARTLIYLQERGIGTYDELKEKIQTSSKLFNGNQDRIKTIETRQKEISELQRQIGIYGKTKEAYAEYKRLKKHQPTAWEKFTKSEHPASVYYEAHRADIALHQAAKKYFDTLGTKKLPSINMLRTEYAKLDAEKRKLYSDHKPAREDMIALKMAKQNIDIFLGEPRQPEQKRSREQSR
jgi:hypothetical protein